LSKIETKQTKVLNIMAYYHYTVQNQGKGSSHAQPLQKYFYLKF